MFIQNLGNFGSLLPQLFKQVRLSCQCKVGVQNHIVAGLLDWVALNKEHGAWSPSIQVFIRLVDTQLRFKSVERRPGHACYGLEVEQDDEHAKQLSAQAEHFPDALASVSRYASQLVEKAQLHELKHLLVGHGFGTQAIFLRLSHKSSQKP